MRKSSLNTNWARYSLKQVIDEFIVPMRDKPPSWAGNIPWCRIEDFDGKYLFGSKSEQFVDQHIIQSMNLKVYPIGTVLCSCSAKLGVCTITAVELVSNQTFIGLVPGNLVDTEFLYYKMTSQAEELQKMSSGTTIAYLPRAKFEDFEIDLPDKSEQQKIATILSTIDRAIAHTEALIEKYHQIKAGLMHDLFTRGIGADGKLRPTREEAPELYQESAIGWIPKDWNWEIVADLCSQVVDCPHSTPTYRDLGIPCIRTADMEVGELLLEQAYCVDEKDYKIRTQRLVPKEGDIIYSREGERLGIASPVGVEKVCLGQRVMLLRPDSNTDPSFLLWSMNHIDFYRRVVRGLGATTSPHVNVGDIKAIPISVPTYSEQVLIGEKINAVQGVLNREKSFRSKLQQKKNGLMHDLLTGKVA